MKNALSPEWEKRSKKKLTPTIRCCEQHLMGGHIACSTIGKIICEKYTKSRMGEEVKKKINPNHQMLFTAPDGWGYFWDGA